MIFAQVHIIRAIYDATGAVVGIASGLAIPGLAAHRVRRSIKHLGHAHSENTLGASSISFQSATEARPVVCGDTSDVSASEDV